MKIIKIFLTLILNNKNIKSDGGFHLVNLIAINNILKQLYLSYNIKYNRVSLTFENKPVDLIISEINIQNKQNHQLFKDFIHNIDCFFLCHEIKENDENFNEESIKNIFHILIL